MVGHRYLLRKVGLQYRSAVQAKKYCSEDLNVLFVPVAHLTIHRHVRHTIISKDLRTDRLQGAALSVKEVANCPIKFMTSGESIESIEIFDPERIAKRILGLADIVGLVEKAQEVFDESSAKKYKKK